MTPDDDEADEAFDIGDVKEYAADLAQQIEESNALMYHARAHSGVGNRRPHADDQELMDLEWCATQLMSFDANCEVDELSESEPSVHI